MRIVIQSNGENASALSVIANWFHWQLITWIFYIFLVHSSPQAFYFTRSTAYDEKRFFLCLLVQFTIHQTRVNLWLHKN